MRRNRVLCCIGALLVLSGCARAPQPVVARMTPPQMQNCVQEIMERHAIRTELAPFPDGIWRLRLSILTGPPSGWVDKGSIVHTGTGLSYIANGATAGLNEAQLRGALEPIFQICR
ncbi:MAG: hypothetical protein AAGB05_15645 [Pseudomonadota bacterium]